MTEQETLESLKSAAREWARAQEQFILERGAPLNRRQLADAARVGVRDADRVRMLVVDRITPPDDPRLAEAARRAQIMTGATRAVTIGYGIIIRADRWQDRELILHQLVHVAQCERSGGLDAFVEEYMADRSSCAEFSVGSLEDEARGVARAICAADEALR
ncbi:MAG TPA: hypothetical protein VF551_07675 [Chthoniobacterales bacterium]